MSYEAVSLTAHSEKILIGAVDAFGAALGQRLVSAYALGSLAHGGFSPLVSDIDLGLILEDPLQPGDAGTIQAVANRERANGSALAARLSVFWGTRATLRGECDGGRFPPLDRLDLIENGRLLAGVDGRHELLRPDAHELLVSGAEFALDTLAGDAITEICHPARLLRHGPRRMTKLVLFPVRFMFTAATGRVGTNDDAVAWYLARADATASSLVAAAHDWRKAPPTDDTAAAALLGEHLVPLYRQYIDDHVTRLSAAGEPALAISFEEWRGRLMTAAVPDHR